MDALRGPSLGLIFCLPHAFAAARNLVVFRPRSRHTFGFEPAVYDLPQLELKALSARAQLVVAEEAAEEPQLFWADGICEAALRDATQRAICTHGAFTILASAPDAPAAGAAAHRLLGHLPPSITVIDLAQPDLRRAARSALIDAWRSGAPSVSPGSRSLLADEPREWVLIRERFSGRVHFGTIAQGSANRLSVI